MRLFLLLGACLLTLATSKPAACISHRLAGPAPEARQARARPSINPKVCGDLLQQYATKPAGVVFIGCQEAKPGGQTVAVATYAVSGANSLNAERIFHEQYGMGNLTFLCCGWEPAEGKTGQVASAKLRKLNPNYTLLITMYSDAQAIEQAMLRGDTAAFRNRRKVKQFIVEVKIVEV